jgi:hypothetical protein
MPAEILVCRCKAKIAFLNYAILAAMPFFFFGAAIYGLYLHGWRMYFTVFPFAVLTGIFAYFYGAERARLKSSSLEIDAVREQLTFRRFRFIASFLPERPREEEVVRFEQVLGVKRVEVQKGIWGLAVRTEKGTVTISEEMEHFDVIASTLTELAASNASRKYEYRKKLEAEPRIRTAWYGWLILLGAVAIVMVVGWKLMYAD